MSKVKNSILCWTPRTDRITLVPYPDAAGRSNDYTHTTLACFSKVHSMSQTERTAFLLAEAMHLIIRDGMDPILVHKTLCGLDEYRRTFAPDMPRG